MTEDGRLVWRTEIDIDKVDIQVLLKFILSSQEKQCPSIVINMLSLIVNKDFNEIDNFLEPEIIVREIEDVIAELIHENERCDTKGKTMCWLTEENLLSKIHISQERNIYPPNSDHIIDTYCRGAFWRLKSKDIQLSEEKNPKNNEMNSEQHMES